MRIRVSAVVTVLALSCWLLGGISSPAVGAQQAPNEAAHVAREALPIFTAEFGDLGALREALLAQFPDTFAGLVNDGDGRVTVFQTDGSGQIADWIAARFKDAAARDGVDLSQAPRIRMGFAERPLRQLRDLKAALYEDRLSLRVLGVDLVDVGIKDSTNQLVVEVSSDDEVARQVLAERLGEGGAVVHTSTLVNQTDRYNDSPPWNGGDQIVSEESTPVPGYPQHCTTGFGVHTTTLRYVTTAGHCGPHYWWNTSISNVQRTTSRLVGGPLGTIYWGDYSGYRIDTQKIHASAGSSRIIWSGVATRQYITAAVGVAEGDPSCIEGSMPATQSCGLVYAADYGLGNTEYLVVITNGNNTKSGDSGAPSWRSSYYGPLAQGTHVGVLSGSPYVAIEMKINFVLFFNGVALNTISDP